MISLPCHFIPKPFFSTVNSWINQQKTRVVMWSICVDIGQKKSTQIGYQYIGDQEINKSSIKNPQYWDVVCINLGDKLQVEIRNTCMDEGSPQLFLK
jgi:hypothetical protein